MNYMTVVCRSIESECLTRYCVSVAQVHMDVTDDSQAGSSRTCNVTVVNSGQQVVFSVRSLHCLLSGVMN